MSSSLTTLDGRLKTFKLWPNREMEPLKLAEAGFYYTEKNDIVRCPFCLVEGFRWKANDNPLEDHAKFILEEGRECSFLKEMDHGFDTCGKYANASEIPVYPEYTSEELRLDSFKMWPKTQKPEDLASEGFFYLGSEDKVACFQCGGGLKDWDEDDQPAEQHSIWFPNCYFIRKNK